MRKHMLTTLLFGFVAMNFVSANETALVTEEICPATEECTSCEKCPKPADNEICAEKEVLEAK